jgi:hypothetical protein
MYSWLETTTGLRLPTAQTHTPTNPPGSGGTSGGVYRVNTAPPSAPVNRGSPLPTGGLKPNFQADPFVQARGGYLPGYEPSYGRNVTPQTAANPRITPNRPAIPSSSSTAAAPYANRQPVVNNAYTPGANYRPGNAIAAKNAAAARGATGAQAAAAARATASTVISPAQAARGALGASPLIGAGLNGFFTAGVIKAQGGDWWEVVGGGVGAAVGSQLGLGLGLAAATTTANPVVAAAAPYAGSMAGNSIGALAGVATINTARRFPKSVGGGLATLASAIVPGSSVLFTLGSVLRGWLQPETVSGDQIPLNTVSVEGEPPFEGGQSVGVRYIVPAVTTFDPPFSNTVSNFDVYGPVRARRIFSVGEARTRWEVDASNLSGSQATFFYENGVTFGTRTIWGSITRADGQPDTGGNPPGSIVQAPAPSKPRYYNPLDNIPRTADRTNTPPATAPAPNNDASLSPALRPQAPPATAPAAPDPGPALPAGDPLVAPGTTTTPDPTQAPDATPDNVPGPVTAPKTDPYKNLKPGEVITLPDGTTITGTPTGYQISTPVNSSNTLKIPPNQLLRPGETVKVDDFLSPALAPLLAIPALLIPALLTTPTATTGKVGDPTTPGKFTDPPPTTPTPPVPNPPDNGCKCNGPLLANQAAQAAELAALMAELEKIKRAIGVQGLPVSVPDQIAKQTPGQKSISSLAELHLWQVEQLDGVMGRWPQQIPIPTPAGPVNVGMPNMAEAVSELVGMMVSQQVTATQILNTTSRTLAQAGSATQQAHLAHLTAKANAEFLGFESRPSVVDMPLAYTPGQDPFDGLLNESVAKVRGFENADGQDLKSILAELLQAAAIIRAVYWRKLDPRGDLKSQIRQNIRGQGDFVDEAAAGSGQSEDWEAYLRDVEAGFRSATGEDNPYGRPPGEGPQIRDRSPKKGR